ncbi:hypothetical protein Mgra_00005122 [Meloidogyne graminicola]|uniref:Uncharacterized protein n=1 Tax=Meloidogyne graminicola TaxID=189291 RepID=A0A8S9ZQ87_9BILA|nr:hypothetical protein Mgra_00005122 [Meloidogyne graminicola]
MYVWHEKEYLGAAHGLSGILQIFLNYWEFLDAKGKEDVKQTVDWFLTIQLKDGNFPSNAAKIGKEAELVHWCHGATGALHMLISAHLIFGKEKYLEAAKRCAKLIWLKGILIKGPGICHGVAGSGYGFLLLYRHTKEEEWLDKAKAFSFIVMSKIFEQKARTPDHPWSLFEGWSGTLCFLIDLLQPLKAQFPMVPILFNN